MLKEGKVFHVYKKCHFSRTNQQSFFFSQTHWFVELKLVSIDIFQIIFNIKSFGIDNTDGSPHKNERLQM
jgi:hypothetical protein